MASNGRPNILAFCNKSRSRKKRLHIDTDVHTPESKFYGVDIEIIPVNTFHTIFCPSYLLESRLHNAGSIGPPKWEPRSNICVYLGHSPFQARSFALVYNPSTGRVSPQYHILSLMMTSQGYHTWKQEQSHHIGQI